MAYLEKRVLEPFLLDSTQAHFWQQRRQLHLFLDGLLASDLVLHQSSEVRVYRQHLSVQLVDHNDSLLLVLLNAAHEADYDQ